MQAARTLFDDAHLMLPQPVAARRAELLEQWNSYKTVSNLLGELEAMGKRWFSAALEHSTQQATEAYKEMSNILSSDGAALF